MYFFQLSHRSRAYRSRQCFNIRRGVSAITLGRRSNGNSSRLRCAKGREGERSVAYDMSVSFGSTLLSHRRSRRRNEKLSDCFIVSTGNVWNSGSRVAVPGGSEIGVHMSALVDNVADERRINWEESCRNLICLGKEGEGEGARPRLALFATLPVIKY